MSHLLSSVDPVLYDTNRPAHAPIVLSLASSAASVIASSLGPLWIVHCIVLLHRVAHSLSVHYYRSCVVVRFIHHALILSIPASNATDPANHESSMMIRSLSIVQINGESAMIHITRASIISQNNITISQKM
jgi:hypothetical protein